MLPRIHSSSGGQTSTSIEQTSASSSTAGNPPIPALSPKVLQKILSTISQQLKQQQAQETRLHEAKTQYFNALPEQVTAKQSPQASPSLLEQRLEERQKVAANARKLQANLKVQTTKIRDTRQHIRDIHTSVYKSIILQRDAIAAEGKRLLREKALLNKQVNQQIKRIELTAKPTIQSQEHLLQRPEVAHAAHCVNLLLPLGTLNASALKQHPTDSPLLKTLFMILQNWMKQDLSVSSVFWEKLLAPDDRLISSLCQHVELEPGEVKYLMVLMGLNCVLNANAHQITFAKQIQMAIRAVLGRAIIPAYFEHQAAQGKISKTGQYNISRKFGEWYFSVDNPTSILFAPVLDQSMNAAECLPPLLSNLARCLKHAKQKDTPLQNVFSAFESALTTLKKEASPVTLLALVNNIASLSFPSLPQIEAKQETGKTWDPNSEFAQTLKNKIGLTIDNTEIFSDEDTAKSSLASLQQLYLKYNPTPEKMYLNTEVQEYFSQRLDSVSNEGLPIRHIIKPQELEHHEMLPSILRHTLGALDYQKQCIELAQTCEKHLAKHQQLAALEQEIQETTSNPAHKHLQHAQDQAKVTQLRQALIHEEHQNKVTQKELFDALTDPQNSPLRPLFIHQTAFEAFVVKHVRISNVQLKQRALEQHRASRYQGVEGLLRAIVEIYTQIQLDEYGSLEQLEIIDDEMLHNQPVGVSMVKHPNDQVRSAEADCSVFSLKRASPNQAWRITHLYPK